MGIFDLPTIEWICEECGQKWCSDEKDNCPNCKSKKVKRKEAKE